MGPLNSAWTPQRAKPREAGEELAPGHVQRDGREGEDGHREEAESVVIHHLVPMRRPACTENAVDGVGIASGAPAEEKLAPPRRAFLTSFANSKALQLPRSMHLRRSPSFATQGLHSGV